MKKRAVFVLGTFDAKAIRKGDAYLDSTLDLLDEVAERAGVDASLVTCVQDPLLASKGKSKIKQKDIMEEQGRVLDEIGYAKPDFVVCFGPVATACVFGKGNLSEGEMLRRAHCPLGEDQPPVYVTFGMENVRYKAGLAKWLALDVQAAAHGYSEPEYGHYEVLLPGTAEWDERPLQLQQSLAEKPIGFWAEHNAIGYDLETYPGLDPWHPDARIRMAVISHRPGGAWVVQATPDSRLPQWVYELIESPRIVKAGSNIKFDYKWQKRFGHEIVNMWDTSTAEHVIDCTNPKKDLKSLSFKYLPRLGDYSKPHRDLVRERGGWEFVEDDEQYDYCGGDGEASIAAYDGQRDIIERHGLSQPHRLMRELYPVLAEMEHVGSRINMEENLALDEKYTELLTQLRGQITEHLGPINPNSPKQLAAALKDAAPDIRLTKRDWERAVGDEEDEDADTSRAVLEREAHKHPVISIVLEFRKYRTRHSTFIKGVRERHAVRHHDQWYVHPTYRSDVVETYRLSSQGPNDQNAPRKDNDDPELSIKRQIISRFPGGKILEADQSQIEIKIAAWLSQDQKMLEAITSGEDIHTSMAKILLNKDEVTKEERQSCKHRTFLILYGGGAKKLARDLGTSQRAAQIMIDEYFQTFTGLRDFIERTHAEVRRDLRVHTPFGFVRRFTKPDRWDSPEGWTIQRQSFNTKVQSTAVCVTYASMIFVHNEMHKLGLKSKLIKQVHDSMVFDVHPDEIDTIVELARRSMESACLLVRDYGVSDMNVPLHSDVEIGDNWADVQEYQAN